MNQLSRLVILGLLAGVTAGCGKAANDELGSKPEWSVLQSLEVQHRDTAKASSGPLVRKEGTYCAAGLIAVDGASRVWILLNAEKEPLVKKLPDLDYKLSNADMVQIESQCVLSDAVRRELVGHIVG